MEKVHQGFRFPIRSEIAADTCELLQRVSALEEGLRAGRLNDCDVWNALNGCETQLCDYYERLLLRSTSYSSVRTFFYPLLVNRIALTERSRITYFASVSAPGTVKVEGFEPFRLPFEQLIATLRWGMDFAFPSEDQALAIIGFAFSRTNTTLAAGLNDLCKIERRMSEEEFSGSGSLISCRNGHAFESLIADILNEEHRCAYQARFLEDMCEKTDLRVRFSHLARPRGARVQVKLTSNKNTHEIALSTMRRIEEFVIVSPRTLAAFFCETYFDRSEQQVERLWDALGTLATNEDELATALLDLFLQAIKKIPIHPGGPAYTVPKPIRELVQEYVGAKAIWSTSEMRQRLANE